MTTEHHANTTSSMPTHRKVLCGIYAAVAAAGLVATWGPNLAYSPALFLRDFMNDLTVTAASRSYTGDLMVLALAAVILMVVEARRHGVKFVWLYVVGGFVTAISFTFPLFLIARELRADTSEQLRLRPVDWVLLMLLTAFIVGNVVWINLQ